MNWFSYAITVPFISECLNFNINMSHLNINCGAGAPLQIFTNTTTSCYEQLSTNRILDTLKCNFYKQCTIITLIISTILNIKITQQHFIQYRTLYVGLP